jgi:DNA-binding response OmpR family regulator
MNFHHVNKFHDLPKVMSLGSLLINRNEMDELNKNLQTSSNLTQLNDIQDSIKSLEKDDFEILIIQADLDEMDGRDFCRLVRRRGATLPIIILAKNYSPSDEIWSLESGASDHVNLSLNIEVLKARIRAHIRNKRLFHEPKFEIGDFVFDPLEKILVDKFSKEICTLTYFESALLQYLCTAGGRAVPHYEILENVWGYGKGVQTNTLKTHLYRLRKKLNDCALSKKFLITKSEGILLAR